MSNFYLCDLEMVSLESYMVVGFGK